MNIAIDARTLSVKGGSKTYLYNLLRNFKETNSMLLLGASSFFGYNTLAISLDQQNPFFRLFWENILLPIILKNRKIELFHGTKGAAPLVATCKKIITVHDLIGIAHPKFLRFLDMVYWSKIIPVYLKHADHLIAVSEATKADLVQLLGIEASKITVIHEAYAKDLYLQKNERDCYLQLESFAKTVFKQDAESLKKKKIILNVNTISSRKNIQSLIKAFDYVAQQDPLLVLVICGKRGWKYEEIFNAYELSPVKERIFFVSYIDDEIMACLYNIAFAFVYPSFYEGFGLPILEAQACGCPVIASRQSSMPEVGGDGALYIDPHKSESIVRALQSFLKDESLRAEMIEKGLRNKDRFSWERCAQETEDLYKRVLYGA